MRDITITDIHTHLLPGIDDGSENWDMTLDMIQRSWDAGVRRIVATPHYLPWRPETTPEGIQSLCREAEDKSRKELGLDMKIYPGQEIFFHLDIIKQLQEGKIQTMNGSRYLLVEFDPGIPWYELRHAVQMIGNGGYKPILAHIERYECLHKKNHVEELLDYRANLQINIRSLSGGLFDSRASWCRKQIKEENIDFLASDMHNLTSRPPFSEKGLDWLHKKLDPAASEYLLGGYAGRCLGIK